MTDRLSPERLALYLRRIGLPGSPSPDACGLAAIVAGHQRGIGFENLDIRLGRTIAIDADAVFAKLVTRGRGGYCFEKNRLVGDALAAIGIASRPLQARVLLGQPEGAMPPRTHTARLAVVEGAQWLADGGFGGSTIPPLPLMEGAEALAADGARHRLRRIGAPGSALGEWLLERAGPPEPTDGRGALHTDWQPQYAFGLEEVAEADLAMASHWTATRPGTRFTTHHIASIALTDGFASLTDHAFSVTRGRNTERRIVTDPADYARTLRDLFAIALSDADAAALPLFAR